MNAKAIAALSSEDLQLRNAALVYLNKDENLPATKLAEMCKLAASTIRKICKKFLNLLEWAREKFQKTYTGYYVYIDKITMADGSEWCKIGQTKRSPEERAKEFKWCGRKPVKIEVKKCFQCLNETAMNNLEDLLRVSMTFIHPEKFCKNDRLLCWEDDFPERICAHEFAQRGIMLFAI